MGKGRIFRHFWCSLFFGLYLFGGLEIEEIEAGKEVEGRNRIRQEIWSTWTFELSLLNSQILCTHVLSL